MVKGLKCSGVRFKSGKPDICASKAKEEHGYFCSHEHSEQGKDYASADTLREFVTFAKQAFRKPHLTASFNDDTRQGMFRAIRAGMLKEEAEYAVKSQQKMAEAVEKTYSEASSVYDSDTQEQTAQAIENAKTAKESIKNKKRSAVFDALGSQEPDDEQGNNKRRKTAPLLTNPLYDEGDEFDYIEDEDEQATTSNQPPEVQGFTAEQIEKARNAPLPASMELDN